MKRKGPTFYQTWLEKQKQGDCSINFAVWIGANDINKENYFVWSSDNSSFLNSTWSPSQPNNSGENEDCVEIWSYDKYTNDAPCAFLSHHLCQLGTAVNFYLEENVFQASTGLHGDLCVTSLLPSSLWRYSYDFARSSDAYKVYVYIVVKATVTSGRATNDTIQWTCQSIAGTAFSGCFTLFPTDTNYLHLQLLNETDPFGAYLVGYDNTSLFCHPLGIADIMEHINTKPFLHALFLQRLKEKQKSTCESMTSEKPTLETSNLTTILSVANDSSISTLSTTDSNSVLVKSASVAITTPQSATWPNTSPGSTGLREAIISFLKVDHSELSSHKRNLISAPDPRTSSQICGFIGILLVLSVVLFIIYPDLVSIVRIVITFIK
ncbi:uncharacterized protein LOC129922704 [Biomphalaria glabrata]|uniref:Uncharacterized protein LOC129922704 n=1 Tax=Biomphalaria glabrata TaxID=6526 RepID=A0A9W2YS80_BIOGL|nr:uncharacterized protein LOC129922704 [Biomphalaria glabrata]